jgi:pyridoxal phosphate enzyme (YggS family)
MATIEQNLQKVHARIAAACALAERSVQSVRLLSVSKTFPPSDVRSAHAAGERAFGENYVQEGVDKIAALADLRSAIEWHLIGPLQSNKTRIVAEHFDWVHSVDRLKIAERLSDQRPADLPPLQLCLQVNISGESTKSGLNLDELPAVAKAVAALPRVRLRGLMAIPEPALDEVSQRAPHAHMRRLFESLRADGVALDTLSIGMSADLEVAIVEGSTLVRVGTAIFGAR